VNGRTRAGEELRELAKRESLGLQVVELDVTDDGSVGMALRTVIDESGRIAVLLNNAATTDGCEQKR